MAQNKNRSARIVTEKKGKTVKTRTAYRDPESVKVSVMTSDDFTSLRIRVPNYGFIFFDGSTSRTIYRTLQNHYRRLGRSW
jgi:hypothetical protein